MKANKKVILSIGKNDSGYVKIVGGLIALLLMIIVGILVYWETQGSISAFEESSETFTSDSGGTAFTVASNASAWQVELDNSPTGAGAVNVTCFYSVTKGLSYPTFTLTHRHIDVAADGADNFTQVNVTYTSNMANVEDSTSDMATTVFNLLPVIALAVVASIIIGIIVGFGGSSKRL